MVLFFWPKLLDFEYLSACLKKLHTATKYTFEKPKLIQSNHSQPYQVLNFLGIEVILHFDNTVENNIYYKDTNAHDYFPHNNAHPKYCEGNFPYNLAKRIIVFVSNDEKVEMRLKELKKLVKGL